MERAIEIDGIKVEVLEPASDSGTVMFHVEPTRRSADLWLYRTDNGVWRSPLTVGGCTASTLEPIGERITRALEEEAA